MPVADYLKSGNLIIGFCNATLLFRVKSAIAGKIRSATCSLAASCGLLIRTEDLSGNVKHDVRLVTWDAGFKD